MIQTNNLWQVRPYDAADAPMLHAWAAAHGSAFVEGWLPPNGVIACLDGEPKAALWLYLSYGVGVGFLEHAYAVDGLRLADAKTAFHHCVESLRAVARMHNTPFLFAYTTRAIAGVLSDITDCQETNRGLVQLAIPASP